MNAFILLSLFDPWNLNESHWGWGNLCGSILKTKALNISVKNHFSTKNLFRDALRYIK